MSSKDTCKGLCESRKRRFCCVYGAGKGNDRENLFEAAEVEVGRVEDEPGSIREEVQTQGAHPWTLRWTAGGHGGLRGL